MENIEYILLGILFISQIIIIFVLINKNKKGKLKNTKGDKLMKKLEEKIDKISKEIEHYNKVIESSKKLDKEDGKRVERILSKKLDSLKRDLLTLDSSKEIFDKIDAESQKRKNDIYNEANKLKNEIKNTESSIINKINTESSISKVEFNKLNKHFEENTIEFKNKLDDKFKKLNRKLDDDLEENFDKVLDSIEEIKEGVEGYEGNLKKLKETVDSILGLLKQEGIEIRNIIPPDVENEKIFIEMQKVLVAGIDSLVNNSRHLAVNYDDLEALPATRARLAELEQIKEKKEGFDKLIVRINEIKEELPGLEKTKNDLDRKLNEQNNKLSGFKEKNYYDSMLSELKNKNGEKENLENSILNLEELIKNKKETDDRIKKLTKGKNDLINKYPKIMDSKLLEKDYLKDKINKVKTKIEDFNKKEKKDEDDKKGLKESEEEIKDLNSLDDTINQIKNDEKKLEELKNLTEDDLNNKRKELKVLETEINELNNIKENAEEFDNLNKEIKEIELEIEKTKENISELTTEHDEKIKELGLGGE